MGAFRREPLEFRRQRDRLDARLAVADGADV
jgi:hypothetical protein